MINSGERKAGQAAMLPRPTVSCLSSGRRVSCRVCVHLGRRERQAGRTPQVTIVPRAQAVGRATRVLPKANIRVDSTLVLIPVTVTDPHEPLRHRAWKKKIFKVFEDKKEQEITQFSSEDAPLSVGVIFDCSGSMGHKLEKSRQAVAQFFKTANPEDEFFLVQFNDTAESGAALHAPTWRKFRTA